MRVIMNKTKKGIMRAPSLSPLAFGGCGFSPRSPVFGGIDLWRLETTLRQGRRQLKMSVGGTKRKKLKAMAIISVVFGKQNAS